MGDGGEEGKKETEGRRCAEGRRWEAGRERNEKERNGASKADQAVGKNGPTSAAGCPRPPV